jgi:hypothetical protein
VKLDILATEYKNTTIPEKLSKISGRYKKWKAQGVEVVS